MIWNDHLRDIPQGAHAPFGASKYFWLNYDEEKALLYYKGLLATKKGTELHDLAKRCIDNRVQLKGRSTLARYVNDAIGFRMRTEQPLVYSKYFFGTADAIIFKNDLLRIHDFKSGVTPAKMDQLLIYDALFCLEYRKNPDDFSHELRIYQSDDIISDSPSGEEVRNVMDKIISFNKVITDFEEGKVL